MNGTNGSQQIQPYSLSVFGIFSVCTQAIIIVTALLGNLLVCLAICTNKQLRSSATNCFILSLAFSDLLTATLSMPFDLEQILTGWRWTHGEVLCQVWTTVYLIAVPSSILSLLAVSVDRFRALRSDPLNSSFMTGRRARLTIAGLWLYTITFALVPIMGWNTSQVSVSEGGCNFNIATLYSIISSFVNFVIPTIIMCSLYFKIYHIVRRFSNLNMHRSVSQGSMLHRREQKIFKRSVKATRNIRIIVCVFFVCWMPFTLTSLAINFCGERCLQKTPPELLQSFLILGYLNSALNPPLYSLSNRKIMNTYRHLCNVKSNSQRATPNAIVMAVPRNDCNTNRDNVLRRGK